MRTMKIKKKTLGIILAVCLVFTLTFVAMSNTNVINSLANAFGTYTDVGTVTDVDDEPDVGTPTDPPVVEPEEEVEEEKKDSDSKFGFSFLSRFFERIVNFFKNLFNFAK